jgi:hypothetical protein
MAILCWAAKNSLRGTGTMNLATEIGQIGSSFHICSSMQTYSNKGLYESGSIFVTNKQLVPKTKSSI